MKKKLFYPLVTILLTSICSCSDENFQANIETSSTTAPVLPDNPNTRRMLWASINGRTDAVHSDYKIYNDKILVSWRMLPSDENATGFDLYRKSKNGKEIKLNSSPIINSTNFQDTGANYNEDNTYRLCYAGQTQTLDTYTITTQQTSSGFPYISIPLKSTTDIHPTYEYRANDISVGDVDGDGIYEIILKRILTSTSVNGGEEAEDNEDIKNDDITTTNEWYKVPHYTLLEAYKLDGTFLWRVKLGPNVLTGNGSSFAVYDFNRDGKCEIALRTVEGTEFGDGTIIGDTDGDGKTDYRVPGTPHIHGGPEFLSVLEGATGKELTRTNYIALGKSEDWGDNYYKRSASYRISMGHFSGSHHSILICRGVYAKSVLEAWDFLDNKLVKRWRFDTDDGIHSTYAGQGNHSLSILDVDNDGYDEIVYGACTIDHNGKGLYSSGFGHGDALHVGKFDPSRKGYQIWSCFEGGPVGAACRDACTGEVLWRYDNPGDIGRALVADIDPDSPGCEMWWYKSNVHSCKGEDLGYQSNSCNMAIWFSGSLNRQLLDASKIDAPKKGRIFTLYRYDVITINSSKENPCFYGDIVGDWREEVIQVTKDNSELRIFSTWYPTEYKFPWLMTDHVYEMSALNQNVGYNQPTQLGYYLGSDLIKEKDI